MNESLAHHGILGQKWGVRRFQNKDGSLTEAGRIRQEGSSRTIKKGEVVTRVATKFHKDETDVGRSYVSTNAEDHKQWLDYMGNENARYNNIPVIQASYEAMEDMVVADAKTAGKIVSNMMSSKGNDKVYVDAITAFKKINGRMPSEEDYKKNLTYPEIASLLVAANTDSGYQLMNELKRQGYSGMDDYHGRWVSDYPLIIFDMDKRTKLINEAVEWSYYNAIKEQKETGTLPKEKFYDPYSGKKAREQ